MNKHIELVKRWLNNPESVSPEELRANYMEAADTDTVLGDEECAAYLAAHAASESTFAFANVGPAHAIGVAAYWVEKYEEFTK